jgi:hypothetical protein
LPSQTTVSAIGIRWFERITLFGVLLLHSIFWQIQYGADV